MKTPEPNVWQWLLAVATLCSLSCRSAEGGSQGQRSAQEMEDLYGLRSIPEFSIEVSEDAAQALRESPRDWTKSTFSYQGDTFKKVAIRIKGHRSLRSFDEKPSFKLRFDKGKSHKSRRFLGERRLTLNNLVEDPTMIREYLAYRLARELDLPVPRAGFAELTVNGQSYGLYLAVEHTGPEFLERTFGSSKGELFEGEYGCDLYPEDVPGFDMEHGENRSALTTFASLAQEDSEALWTGPNKQISLEHLTTFLAFSNYVGDFDGYQHSHNYRMYRNPETGLWQLMSWGLDRAFHKKIAPFSSRGVLAKKCFASQTCRTEYLRQLRRVHQVAERLDLATGAKVVSRRIRDAVNADTRRPYSAERVVKHRKKLLAFLEGRARYVADATSCLDSEGNAVDHDGDGYACMDCNDRNASIHPGASETCDGIDNSCSGQIDDAPTCECTIATVAGRVYNFCATELPQSEAAAFCEERGQALASFSSPEQLAEARELAVQLVESDWWIGANDRGTEGRFLWQDSSPVADSLWAKGEPDNASCHQDCTVLHDKKGGKMRDTHCGQHKPFICESVSSPAESLRRD